MAAAEPESPEPFESLLSLESTYYAEGYDLGLADGAQAGRLEGRSFGMEKGFEKFLEMGRLNGKASVWHVRSSQIKSVAEVANIDAALPEVRGNERLHKHLTRLTELTDSTTISTENSEDAVAQFDDRLRDARAKARLISHLLGDSGAAEKDMDDAGGPTSGTANAVRVQRKAIRKPKVASGSEMEDFAGLPDISGTSKR